MRAVLALSLCVALSGCVHNLRDCPEPPDYAGFARDMDEISLMRRNGLIDGEMATQLYAMEAIALRTEQLAVGFACESRD